MTRARAIAKSAALKTATASGPLSLPARTGGLAHHHSGSDDSFVLGLIARAYEKKGNAAKATEYYRKVMAATRHSINTAFAQQWARKFLKP